MKTPSTYLFAGGGTGGHLFPGIAVARELQRRDPTVRVVFVGSTRSIESSIVAEQGFEHRTQPVEPLPTLKRNPLKFAWNNVRAWFGARQLLRDLKPTAVIGLGGFASAPLVWGASRKRIPVILLEQNVIPGRTTRWLSRSASHICVTFSETVSRLPRTSNVIVTGNAIRTEIAALYSRSQSSPGQRELLILGGSQGADSLNAATVAGVRELQDLLRDWTIVHQTGPRQVDQIRQSYEALNFHAVVEPFFHDLPNRYATATLVISRAGASTLTELACAGVPMILLPFPFAADDHQRANAAVFENHGAAVIVQHTAPEATGIQLAAALKRLISNHLILESMGNAARELATADGAQRIAQIIEQSAGS